MRATECPCARGRSNSIRTRRSEMLGKLAGPIQQLFRMRSCICLVVFSSSRNVWAYRRFLGASHKTVGGAGVSNSNGESLQVLRRRSKRAYDECRELCARVCLYINLGCCRRARENGLFLKLTAGRSSCCREFLPESLVCLMGADARFMTSFFPDSS